MELTLWQALECLYRWEQRNLPGSSPRHRMALFLRLLRNNGRGVSVGQLYKAIGISGPTMRKIIDAFVDAGLATIELDGTDSRLRLIRGTATLEKKLEEYREFLVRAGRHARPSPPNLAGQKEGPDALPH